MRINLPDAAQTALDLLSRAGHKAWLVGGCVRDAVLGRPFGDIDIATSALPEQTREVFRDYKTIDTGLRHGTLSVLMRGAQFEITTFRSDGGYSDRRRPDSVRFVDGLEEDRLADKKFGSTRRGIAPVYADKYMKKTLRMGDLLFPDTLKGKLADIVEWKNLTVHGGYGHEPLSVEELYGWLETYAMPWAPYVCDVTEYLTGAADAGKGILFEAQLGALRDIDFGIFPYTSSSSTLAAYAPLGAGIPARKLDNVVGIMKAYSSCVGEGPFVCEFFGEAAHALREAGGEYGAATGRPRRVGGFDVVASRYGVMLQGADELALTKLDTLSYLEQSCGCETAYLGIEPVSTEQGIGLSPAVKAGVKQLIGELSRLLEHT